MQIRLFVAAAAAAPAVGVPLCLFDCFVRRFFGELKLNMSMNGKMCTVHLQNISDKIEKEMQGRRRRRADKDESNRFMCRVEVCLTHLTTAKNSTQCKLFAISH